MMHETFNVHDYHPDRTIMLFSDGSAVVRIGDSDDPTPRAIQGPGLVAFALAVIEHALRDKV